MSRTLLTPYPLLSPTPEKNASIEVYLEDGVLGREEKVPALVEGVIHARPRESSDRLHHLKKKILQEVFEICQESLLSNTRD